MAPLGIPTAMSAAIRVRGPHWMKSAIGRAGEDPATTELELMSSTSNEVCELWNGRGIVRMMGQPEIEKIIYLEELRNEKGFEETYGLYTIEEALEKRILREQRIYPYPSINNKKNMV